MNGLDSILFQLSMLTTEVSPAKDLFSESWTEGNLYEIQPVTNVLGQVAVWVISIVGFGIVIFSILKNALSGLYVVNPAFWDKVDQIKKEMVQGANTVIGDVTGAVKGRGNLVAQRVGGFFTWILSHLPNVRQLTDFDEGADIDKKQYFMRSIPLLVAQIFIGMLIFFGYPAKIAQWIGTGATTALSALLKNYDPVQVVTNLSNQFTSVHLSTDGSQDAYEQNINAMALGMTRTMATKYNDMSRDNVQNMAYTLEAELMDAFPATNDAIKSSLGANQGFVFSHMELIETKTPSVSASFRVIDEGHHTYMAMATNGTVTYRHYVSASSLLGGDKYTTKLGSDDYFSYTITATPVAVSDISNASLIICSGYSTSGNISGSSVVVPVYGITVGNGQNDIKGTLGRNVTVQQIINGEERESFVARLDSSNINQTEGATIRLTVAESDKSKLQLSGGGYLRVALTGSWSKTIFEDRTKSTTTAKVTELRLTPGNNKVTYLVSSWEDVDLKTSTGKPDLTVDMLKQRDMKDTDKVNQNAAASSAR